MRRSTVLSLPLPLVFPGTIMTTLQETLDQGGNVIQGQTDQLIEGDSELRRKKCFIKLSVGRRETILYLLRHRSIQAVKKNRFNVSRKTSWQFLQHHRHLSNINCLTAHTACLVCFISTVNGCSKKNLGRPALVTGT